MILHTNLKEKDQFYIIPCKSSLQFYEYFLQVPF